MERTLRFAQKTANNLLTPCIYLMADWIGSFPTVLTAAYERISIQVIESF